MKLTTTRLQLPSPRAWWNLPTPAAAAITIFCLLSIGMLLGHVRSAQPAAAVPTPALAPIIIIASPLPQGIPPTAIPPAAQVAAQLPGNVTVRAIGVFGSPDTASYIGAVEAGRTFAPVARYGATWTQVDMSGSGRVFVRTSDLYGVPDLADLEPTSAPVIVERPVYVAAPLPAVATPAPEQYQAAPTTAPQQLVILDRQQWALDAQRAGR